MRGKLFLLAFTLSISVLSYGAQASVTHSPTSLEECVGSSCTITLFSGTRFGYEDSQWKPIENLKSFIGTTNISCVVDYDGVHKVECLDYNYTTIKIKVDGTNVPSKDKADIPVKIIDSLNQTDVKSQNNIDLSLKSNEEITVAVKSDEFIKVGSNSTTIHLDFNDNLADVHILLDSGNITNAILSAFDISSIPSTGITINSATWGMTVVDASYSSPATIYVAGVDILYLNETETGGLWDGLALFNRTQSENDGTSCCDFSENVTDIYLTARALGYGNVTLLLDGPDGDGDYNTNATSILTTTSTSDHSQILRTGDSSSSFGTYVFRSREYFADPNERPHLNITYTASPVSWGANSTSTPTSWDSSTLSLFNVSWTSGGDIDTIEFESNFTGTAANYTMFAFNSSLFSFNRTLPGGSFYWISYANTTQGAANSTATAYFSISTIDNICHVNVTTSFVATDQDVGVATTDTTTTESYCDSGVASLFYDSVAVSNPDVRVHSVGPHIYISNSSGNANYSVNVTGISVTITSTGGSGGGSGGGGGGLTIEQVSNFLSLGENRDIFVSQGQPRFIEIELTNDKDRDAKMKFQSTGPNGEWVILSKVDGQEAFSETFDIPTGGKAVAGLIISVPESVADGEYQIVLNFIDQIDNTGTQITLNLVVNRQFGAGLSIFDEVVDRLSFGIVIKKSCEGFVERAAICIEGDTETEKIPIGWVPVVGTYMASLWALPKTEFFSTRPKTSALVSLIPMALVLVSIPL